MVLSWNCRGARSTQFQHNIRELIRSYKQSIVVLLESRISGKEADDACRIGCKDWMRSQARGFNRGIWVLLDHQEISINVVHVKQYFIHLLISERNGRFWEMSVVFASPKRSIRTAIWKQLAAIPHSFLWLLIGDFNYTVKDGECNTPAGYSTSFLDSLQGQSLIDVGISGPAFTWNQ